LSNQIELLKLSKSIFITQKICNQFAKYFDNERFNNQFTSEISKKLIKNKNNAVQKYLIKKYDSVIKSFRENTSKNTPVLEKSEYVWMLWLQGIENAPILVQKCYERLQKNANGKKVVFLTSDNLEQYVQLPEYITHKFEQGILSPAHYSDAIRLELLHKFGGLWLDSTILIREPIDKNIFELEDFCVKGQVPFKFDYKWYEMLNWESYIWGAKKGSRLVKFIRQIFFDFIKTESVFPDYLLLNHLAHIGRKYIPAVEQAWNEIPQNNIRCELLISNLVNDKQHFNSDVLCDSETNFFKLTNRLSNEENELLLEMIEKI
jgi:hypothetical protein